MVPLAKTACGSTMVRLLSRVALLFAVALPGNPALACSVCTTAAADLLLPPIYLWAAIGPVWSALIKLVWPPSDKKIFIPKVADSDQVKVGEEVFIIGSPYGLTQSLSVGHISGRHR